MPTRGVLSSPTLTEPCGPTSFSRLPRRQAVSRSMRGADATIISTPSSTRNRDGARDPEMHQTANGRQWSCGMMAHVGVDRRTKLFHAVLASAANGADRDSLPRLLHGRRPGSGAIRPVKGGTS